MVVFLKNYHFGDINEMVFDAMPAVKTGFFCLFDDLLEVTIIRITENLREIPSRPVFVSDVIDTLYFFKRRIIAGRRPFGYIFIHHSPQLSVLFLPESSTILIFSSVIIYRILRLLTFLNRIFLIYFFI